MTDEYDGPVRIRPEEYWCTTMRLIKEVVSDWDTGVSGNGSAIERIELLIQTRRRGEPVVETDSD